MKYSYLVGPCVAAAAGFAAGALAMYVFDPDSGKRRRAIAREKTVSTVNEAVEGVQSAARDLKNRAQGVASEARSALSRHRPDPAVDPAEPRLPSV
jgi:gas vesicle protein